MFYLLYCADYEERIYSVHMQTCVDERNFSENISSSHIIPLNSVVNIEVFGTVNTPLLKTTPPPLEDLPPSYDEVMSSSHMLPSYHAAMLHHIK